jgi:hypothetical protein
MTREIDILWKAVDARRAVVDKETNVLWDRDALWEARASGAFDSEDSLRAPDAGQIEVSGIFPGCLQQGAAGVDYSRYTLIGQTSHFLIFAGPDS